MPAMEPAATSALDRLTPLQRETLELLRRPRDGAVRFAPDLIADLTETMNEALAHFADRLDGRELFVTKHNLAAVHACERNFLAPDTFRWTPAIARGQVSHKAIQLMLHWRGEPTPADLVEDAMARLADDDRSIGDYVAGLGEAEAADLRSAAVDRVTKFMECFPPLDWRSWPTTESAVQFPNAGPILLRARVDLMIGRPEGDEARKLIIDFKTGRVSPRHREDLRFYALIETLRSHVPPRAVATYYLDSGRPHVEQVTEAVLRTAMARTLDGIHRMIELQVEGATPRVTPGPQCHWCPIANDCAEGQAYLAGDSDDADRLDA